MSEKPEQSEPAPEATNEQPTEQTAAAPSDAVESNVTTDAFTTPNDSQAVTGTPETSGSKLAATSQPASSSVVTTSSAAPSSTTPTSEAVSTSSRASSPENSVSDAAGSKVRSAKSHHSKADSTKEEAPSRSPTPSSRNRGKKRIKLGELDLTTARIGFLGAGKIAESTINGLIHYAKIQPGRIYVAAPSTKGLDKFKALGCRVTKRNYDIFGRYDCDIVFLCFHGYVVKHCYKLGGNRPHPLTTNYIPHQRHPVYILSMVSGVSMSQVKACLLNPDSTSRYVVEMHRIMLNTAVGHGLGICAVDCEPDSKKLSSPIRQLLSSIAHLEHVPASQMDAACAIGGSGLAFSYYFINALADGAFRMGLSRQQAIRFASKTAQCAAQTMLESGKHPAELRDNVSSPSGAAIYGIHVLEKNDVASGVTAAVEAAHKRANDLATQDITT